MTKKDYEKAVKIVVESGATAVVRDLLAQAFVTLFRHDNPRFDVNRFRKACGQEV